MSKRYNVNRDQESPFNQTTIFGIIHANVLAASALKENQITENQLVALVTRLKEGERVKSKAEPSAIAKGYLREAKKSNCLALAE